MRKEKILVVKASLLTKRQDDQLNYAVKLYHY